MEAKFEELIGKTIISIIGMKSDSDNIIFKTSDNETYVMGHYQECCESVLVDDICGDVDDLINSPILIAEERTSEDNPKEIEDYEYDSYEYYEDVHHTWTFYHIATIKGYVEIRWYGESNGFYSENVDFYKI